VKKFDVALGNPPFKNGLWINFIKKSLEHSDIVAMVHPDGARRYSPRASKIANLLLDNGLQTYTVCTGYFPQILSGAIACSICDKTKDSNPEALKDDTIAGRIMDKIINHNGKKFIAYRHKSRPFVRGKAVVEGTVHDGKTKDNIRTLNSIGFDGPEYIWVDRDIVSVLDGRRYWFINRFFAKSKMEAYIEQTEETIGATTNVLSVERIPGMTAEQFKDMMLTKVKRFATEYLIRGELAVDPVHLKRIPIVNDSEFGLTVEEMDYIDKAITR